VKTTFLLHSFVMIRIFRHCLFQSENALISNKRLSAIVYDMCSLDVRAIRSDLSVEHETLCRFIRVPLGGQMN